MIAAIKSNISARKFVPFRIQAANISSFEKAAYSIASKGANTYSLFIKCVSYGTFFKLENIVKQALYTDLFIYDPIQKAMKKIIAKKFFDQS
jgi:hypothetical protein